MSTKHLKTIVFISLGVFVFLIFGVFGTRRIQTAASTQPKTETQTEMPLPFSPRVLGKPLSTPQETLRDFQSSAFYLTIVDNNLFRPLGWRPPRPREPYRLLGTILPTDANTPKQVILQKIPVGRIYTVTIGDTLDADTTVTDIQPKQVTLENAGVLRTLKLNTTPWIK
ncbi:hypothetical protein F4X10_13080 [Candidatus Poribacteria bacterium]|nr:hypothetical protein [Candidatus Poribacteria bacterium]